MRRHGRCLDNLACDNGICSAPSAATATSRAASRCDPPSDGPDQGCEADCTLSPGAAAIALGGEHSCALLHSGAVRCWGAGDHGKTGLSTLESIGDDETPDGQPDVDVGGPVVELALGTAFSCALRRNGQVYCWGFVDHGRLGYGPTIDQDIGDDETPASAGPLPLPANVVDIAAGGTHACAVVDDGSLYCWGEGTAGKLGYGATTNVGGSNTPIRQGQVPLGESVIAVAAGAGHTCVVNTDRHVRCFGDAVHGILGNGDAMEDIGDDEPASASVELDLSGDVRILVAGSQHSCAVLEPGGDVTCWGFGANGRLGYGDTVDVGDDESLSNLRVGLGGAAIAIDAGRAHTCALVDTGEIKCWGDGTGGKLGQGGTMDLGDTEATLPTAIDPVPVDDGVGATVLGIATGGDHSCARLDGGRVRCWGAGAKGQLGYGNPMALGDMPGERPAGDVPVGG
ncbi:MAG: hypothetical protein U0168_00755 [Nannocystaceae bacterium]